MPYVLLGTDGNEYGPVELDTLVSWAKEGRVGSRSYIRITPSGESVLAHTIPELGLVDQPPKMPPQEVSGYSEYPRAADIAPSQPSKAGLISTLFWSGLAIILIIFTDGYG